MPDWNCVLRMKELSLLKQSFKRSLDHEAIVNVRAVVLAYRTRTLKWNPSLVTYWVNGKRLCMPRPFDWDEFELIGEECEGGTEDVWVEAIGWNSSLF